VHDNEVKAALAGAGIACVSFNGDVLREPWAVVDAAGKPLTRFDDFWEA
jgi:deoxyribodipyrimidine photolyase